MIRHYKLTLPSFSRGFHVITSHIEQAIDKYPEEGLMNIFIQHTSAGLCINENADPTVLQDFERSFNHIVRENEPFYKHTMEGPDDMPAHIKSAMVGSHIVIPIVDGQLDLGTWQGIYLCEFRNRGGRRKLVITMYS